MLYTDIVPPLWKNTVILSAIFVWLLIAFPDVFLKLRQFSGWLRREEERTFSVPFFVILGAGFVGLLLQLFVRWVGPSPQKELIQLSQDLSGWQSTYQIQLAPFSGPFPLTEPLPQTQEESTAAFWRRAAERDKVEREAMAEFQEQFANRVARACHELAKQNLLPKAPQKDLNLEFVASGCSEFFRTHLTGLEMFAAGLMVLAQEASPFPPLSLIGYEVVRIAALSFIFWIVLLGIRHMVFTYRSLVAEVQHLREGMRKRESEEKYTDSY